MIHTRNTSFVIITLHYVVAMLLGLTTFRMALPHLHPYWALFVTDVVATVYIWILGLIYRNVSFYDPYWSVAPPVMLTAWYLTIGKVSAPIVLLLVAVWYWGIRLTYNWAYTFKGLEHEDWRYTKFRTDCHPVIFHLINFWGLNMIPTIVVFLAMLPAFDIMRLECSLNLLCVIGFLVCLAAATLQLVSDTQAHRFRKQHPGKVCNVGLWRHGRHPNYLGEILMWWGVWIMYVSQVGFSLFPWFVVGPISVTVLFCVVSIPLMEHRQLATKPEYAEYKTQTRLFV